MSFLSTHLYYSAPCSRIKFLLISSVSPWPGTSDIIMVFGGKLDILVISADLSQFVSGDDSEFRKEDLNTFVHISIDDLGVGTSPVQYGTEMYGGGQVLTTHLLIFRPEWKESFSVQLSNMMELKVSVYLEVDSGPERLVAQCLTALGDLRCLGHDEETLKCALEMKPQGQMFLEITFCPREYNLRRKKAMYEKNHLHRGHRYVLSSFSDVIKCAFCQVNSHILI